MRNRSIFLYFDLEKQREKLIGDEVTQSNKKLFTRKTIMAFAVFVYRVS